MAYVFGVSDLLCGLNNIDSYFYWINIGEISHKLLVFQLISNKILAKNTLWTNTRGNYSGIRFKTNR